ncbi:MAG: hypothetical protein CMJ39_12575 [Phycisphaerae bacterium]|nr:hypothetical protein [Phycisphaerae bacterium]|tara:strand:- start:394 stop:798 length:405 start_codon:yes stop_codon:yes gene_type:complete
MGPDRAVVTIISAFMGSIPDFRRSPEGIGVEQSVPPTPSFDFFRPSIQSNLKTRTLFFEFSPIIRSDPIQATLSAAGIKMAIHGLLQGTMPQPINSTRKFILLDMMRSHREAVPLSNVSESQCSGESQSDYQQL